MTTTIQAGRRKEARFGPLRRLATLLPIATACVLITARPVAAQNGARCAHLPEPRSTVALANDNRMTAGALESGVLSLRLVPREAAWFPDGRDGCGVNVLAFAAGDAPPSIPGPMIRVRAGTRVRVTVHNPLDRTLAIGGLHDRGRQQPDSVRVLPGDSAVVEFVATTPGNYLYRGRVAGNAPSCCGTDGQLTGAVIVEPGEGSPPDRVLVLTRWSPPGHLPLSNSPDEAGGAPRFELNAINGRSWPHTERLTYMTGDTVRLRVVNASGDLHIMHLHGFHFRLTSRGDNAQSTTFARGAEPLLVSEPLVPEQSITLEWDATRAGNWIFHCHLQRHMSGAQRLERIPGSAHVAHHGRAHAEHDMAGLVIGLTVRPSPDYVERDDVPRHRIRLFANRGAARFGTVPGLAFVVQEGDREPAADSVRLPGSPLLLRRNEPTEIVVHNRLGKPLSVHWHGLELESYFDGVAGWSGLGDRIAPPIAPGDSFAVRITPPRAGTFIYHVHHGETHDLAAGLYGAFLVLDADAPRTIPPNDRLFVLSRVPGNDTALVVNGTRDPEPMEIASGETYRFRFIGIMPGEADIITLADPARIAQWKVVARDGVESSTAEGELVGVAAGMTLDFELTASRPGELAVNLLTVDAFGRPVPKPTTIVVRVR